jgi:phosphoglycolate phosphatase
MTIKYKNIKVIAFDFDGVLVDSLHHNIAITNAACSKFNSKKDVTVEDLQNIDRMAFDDVAELIGVPRENFKLCLEQINRQLVETYDSLLPFPGIMEALNTLSQTNLHLIIVTHNTQLAVNAFLEKHKVLNYFSLIMGAETPGEKAEKLASAGKKLNVSSNEIIMIGDSAGDITSAIEAEVIPIGVAWGFQKPKKLIAAGAAKILKKSREIAYIKHNGINN